LEADKTKNYIDLIINDEHNFESDKIGGILAHTGLWFYASDPFYGAANVNLSKFRLDTNFEHLDEPECI